MEEERIVVHIKWFSALAMSVAASIAATFYVTEAYLREITTAQLADMSITRNTTYTAVATDIADGKYEAARTKLRVMFDLEVEDIRRAKAELEAGYFQRANTAHLARIDRYLGSPDMPGKP